MFNNRIILVAVAAALCNACGGDFLGNDPVGEYGSQLSPVHTCTPNAATGGVEECNGIDDDCNDLTDEDASGALLTKACYPADPATKGVGVCKEGKQYCQNGDWISCEGEVTPSPEICDAEDNDCNGVVDDGFPTLTCGTGECTNSVQQCNPQGGLEQVCNPYKGAKPEICDAKDNDCDGATDELPNESKITEFCYNGPDGTEGVGECTTGITTCKDGVMTACTDIGPSPEICDSKDNDCDAITDNGYGTGQPCTVGAGECQKSGVIVCTADGKDSTCSVKPGAPSAEVCDAKDNDCDGATDEAAGGGALTQSCYTGAPGTAGVGLCKTGIQTCANGSFGACAGETTPAAEVCDGFDNDCDTVVDEGVKNTCTNFADCSTFTTCAACDPTPAEVCDNGKDEDCDGAPDDGCPQPPPPPGAPDCDSPEFCDGEDNDCDGATDEAGCVSPDEGTAFIHFESTGACAYSTLVVKTDFPDGKNWYLYEFSAVVKEATFELTPISSGLHRVNIEFDKDGVDGNDTHYAESSGGQAVVHTECLTFDVWVADVKLPNTTLFDPRPPAGVVNLFYCVGPDSQCYLCGDDWDKDGTADCDEAPALCSSNLADKAACL